MMSPCIFIYKKDPTCIIQ